MTAPPCPDTDPTDPSDDTRALYAQQIAMLGELAQLGLEIDRQVVRIARDAWDIAGVEIAARGHARVARAVRLTLMLQARLIKALEAWKAHGGAPAPVLEEWREAPPARIADPMAGRTAQGAAEVERLVRETAERLDRDDVDALLARPFSEAVARVRRDLRIDLDGPDRAREPCARAEPPFGAPGWPLAKATARLADAPGAVIHGRFKPSG